MKSKTHYGLSPENYNEIIRIKDRLCTILNKSKRIVLYTALFGKIDKLHLHDLPQSNLWDIVIITDQNLSSFNNDGIVVINTTLKLNNDRMSAKLFKVLPNAIFPCREISLYYDYNCIITRKTEELVKSFSESNNVMSCFHHNERKCAYRELICCYIFGKEKLIKSLALLRKLLGQRYPANAGLIQGGFLLRKHRHSAVKEMMEAWWNHIQKYSERDQITFNYVAWLKRFQFEYIADMVLHDSPYTRIIPHRSLQFNKQGDVAITFRSRLWECLNNFRDRYLKTNNR